MQVSTDWKSAVQSKNGQKKVCIALFRDSGTKATIIGLGIPTKNRGCARGLLSTTKSLPY